VKQIDENTKEISSLGRSGEQPHFSRASQLVRYIIEPREEGWLLEGEGASWDKVEVTGNFLKLSRPDAETIPRTEDWRDYYYLDEENLEIEDGSLMLVAAEPPPPEEPSLDCGTITASSIEIIYKFSNASDVSLYRNSLEIERLGSGTRSDNLTDTGLSQDTSYIYNLKDEEIFLASTTCTTSELKPEGETCNSSDECESGNCYRDEDGDRYSVIPGDGIKYCQTDSSLGSDCYDKSSNARPGQTGYFTTTRGTSVLGDDAAGNTWNSYDYDCDGSITKNYIRYTTSSCSTECGCGQTCRYYVRSRRCSYRWGITIRCH